MTIDNRIVALLADGRVMRGDDICTACRPAKRDTVLAALRYLTSQHQIARGSGRTDMLYALDADSIERAHVAINQRIDERRAIVGEQRHGRNGGELARRPQVAEDTWGRCATRGLVSEWRETPTAGQGPSAWVALARRALAQTLNRARLTPQ